MNQVRVRYILRNNIAWLSLDFLLAAYNLDSTTTGRSTWLHDVHVLVVVILSVHDELSVIVRE